MYRLTWWSVTCLPGINVPPAIAGATSIDLAVSEPSTGHHSCRHPVIVIVVVQELVELLPNKSVQERFLRQLYNGLKSLKIVP